MKLGDVIPNRYLVTFTGTVSVPTTMQQEEFIDELQHGDVFTIGGALLMTDEVRINGFRRARNPKRVFVFDVSVRGSVRVPSGMSKEELLKAQPAVFGNRIVLNKIDVQPIKHTAGPNLE